MRRVEASGVAVETLGAIPAIPAIPAVVAAAVVVGGE
jgi:hypothetical protein